MYISYSFLLFALFALDVFLDKSSLFCFVSFGFVLVVTSIVAHLYNCMKHEVFKTW